MVTVTGAADGVALVTLRRPTALNALDGALIAQLRAELATLRDDDRYRVVVLTGAGRAFCAGLDVHYYARRIADPANRSPARRMELQQAIADLVTELRALRQPVIAAVNGAAAGGGMGLALACDLRVVADTASFHSAFIALGLGGTDIGVSWLLPRIIGATKAFEIMLTGRPVPAAEALDIGLVNRVVPAGDLLSSALELAGQIAAHSPMGLWMTKEVMWSQLEVTSLRAGLDLENRSQVVTTLTHDHDEAVTAFLERRPPSFTNS
ncbi:enoyl-CoA hydratase/isomerase family protein [Mycolicibacterium sp. S2-37]|nr:enoyl-CoA hydratase/isomerase family protein [Mycolicibacterium sp. S2-37]